jgi:hypothetical protein
MVETLEKMEQLGQKAKRSRPAHSSTCGELLHSKSCMKLYPEMNLDALKLPNLDVGDATFLLSYPPRIS